MKTEDRENYEKLMEVKVRLGAGLITYKEAQAEAAPLLEAMNAKGREIAKKYGMKYREITFKHFMR